MDPKIQEKINRYLEIAKSKDNTPHTQQSIAPQNDSLSQVIRSKKEAETFMAELNSVIQRARQNSK